MTLSFDEWRQQVDGLCTRHLLNDWANLCGDFEPLVRGYETGQDPREFVQWFAEKYDLVWVDPDDPFALYF